MIFFLGQLAEIMFMIYVRFVHQALLEDKLSEKVTSLMKLYNIYNKGQWKHIVAYPSSFCF